MSDLFLKSTPIWIQNTETVWLYKIVSGTLKETNRIITFVKRKLKFSSPNAFAEKKEIVDISYPGDIVGLHDTGNLKLRYVDRRGNHEFQRNSKFSPEHFDTSIMPIQ
jgi:peptide chain release factor 3